MRFLESSGGTPYSWASTPDLRTVQGSGGPFSSAGLYQWDSVLAGSNARRCDFNQRPALIQSI